MSQMMSMVIRSYAASYKPVADVVHLLLDPVVPVFELELAVVETEETD